MPTATCTTGAAPRQLSFIYQTHQYSLQPNLHGSSSEDFHHYFRDYYAFDFIVPSTQAIGTTVATQPAYPVATDNSDLFGFDASPDNLWFSDMMTADHSLDLSSFDNTCLPDFDSTVCDNTTPSTLSQTSDSAERVQPTNHNVQSYHSLNNLDQVPLLCPNHNAETSTAISSPAMSKYSSSSSAATHGRGGARKKSPSSPRANAVERRRNNTLAARRYRQKRLDHIEELETALASTSQERDDLKVKVARLEGELAGLRELLKAKAQS